MTVVHKVFGIEVVEATKSGGRIIINTASVDRDRDRVLPGGCRAENYLKNPVVQWGHEYRAPWSTIGKTVSMTIEADRITAEFELRPAANDQDPQNIIRLLWEGGWVRTASIGFIPRVGKQNDLGGYDFGEWELLEWSLVPIPANQDALRLAVKGMDAQTDELTQPEAATAGFEGVVKSAETKRGRVLSSRNEELLRDAIAMLQQVLAQIDEQPDQTPGTAPGPGDDPDEDPHDPMMREVEQVMRVTESEKSTDAAPVQANDPRMLAGDDGADAAAAAERELAETLRAYFKTVKEVLA